MALWGEVLMGDFKNMLYFGGENCGVR